MKKYTTSRNKKYKYILFTVGSGTLFKQFKKQNDEIINRLQFTLQFQGNLNRKD